MSGKDHDTRAHPKRHNKISGQFTARPIEMLESPAYRALSQAAHKVISRIEVELAHHGGNDNGRLPVTTDQFVEYGMHRSSVAPAIREAEALGFIRVTEHGRGGNAEHRRPNLFYLTFSNWRGSKAEPPPHDWRKIKTVEDAERIAAEARNAKDRSAVKNGRAAWTKRQTRQVEKHFPVRKNRTEAGTEKLYRNTDFPGTEKPYYSVRSKNRTTSISSIGEAKRSDTSPDASGERRQHEGIAMKEEVTNSAPKRKPDLRLVWSKPTVTELPWNDATKRLYETSAVDAALAAAA